MTSTSLQMQEYYQSKNLKDSYPLYNPDLPGYLCSSCGSITLKNFDDMSLKVAPLCEVCRNQWDEETKAELETLKIQEPEDKKFPCIYITKDYPYIKNLNALRDSPCVPSKRLQQLTEEYLVHKEESNQGQLWINGIIKNEKFTNTIIAIKVDSRYDYKPADLLTHNETRELIKEAKKIKYGLSKYTDGFFVILELT